MTLRNHPLRLRPEPFRPPVWRTGAILAVACGAFPAFALAGPSRKPAPATKSAEVRREPVVTYERDILPLMRARCLGCHGAALPHAGLDVRTRGDLLEGGHSGPAVVPGFPEKSLLYRMLADGRMPQGGSRVPAAELKKVAGWIRAGAPGKDEEQGHWAFRPPARPVVPTPRETGRSRNPIDRFLLATLEKRDLSFGPEADRRTLIRRVTYDLIGLPPTPEEVDRLVQDSAPDAYEKVVDRLLADPRFGERWARHWLDAAGYAESEGVLQEDRVRPNAWRYRDYVIRSFNQDKPYDQFLREQIAGDEISDYRNAREWSDRLTEQITATGFLRTPVDGTRDDFNPHQYGEYQYRMLHDVQTVVGTAVLGLNLQCARCHDHKYEPISQKDYYRVQSLFMGAVRPRGTLLPTSRRQVIAATADEQKRAREVNAAVDAAVARLNGEQAALAREYQLRALDERLPSLPEAERQPLRAAFLAEEAKRSAEQKALLAKHAALLLTPEKLSAAYPDFRERLGSIRQARETETRKRIPLVEIRAFYDQDAAPPPTPLLNRGDWLRPGDPVEPGIPTILDDPRRPFRIPPPAPGAGTTGRRKALAEWLTRPDHPLTARVIVNRLWAHHFGTGIVASLDNFGRSGQPPSHPELLDWLAVWFAESGAASRLSHSPTPPLSHSASPNAQRRTPNAHTAPPGAAWSLKQLHRLIVTSAAYRQSSRLRPEAEEKDPENRLLWRQRPRRLEAEAIRDGMLAVSGTLDGRMFGEPTGTETRPSGEIVPAGEEKGGRRSIYLLVRRSLPVTFLNSFDAPVMETNCTRRVTSTTATQALALLNSSFVSSQAGHFARRLLRENPPGAGALVDRATVDRAYRLALSRPPSPAEHAATADFLRGQWERYRSAGKGSDAVELAYTDLCQALLSANEFAYVD